MHTKIDNRLGNVSQIRKVLSSLGLTPRTVVPMREAHLVTITDKDRKNQGLSDKLGAYI